MNAPVSAGAFTLEPTPAPKLSGVRRRGGWSWGPVEGAELRVLSLGAGVQSTTLVEMMIAGELPWVDVMLFSDTRNESAATMRHLADLEARVTLYTNGQVRVIRGGRGERLSDAAITRKVSIPLYTKYGKGKRRQCTKDFKGKPLAQMQRAELGYRPRQRIAPGTVEVQIAFSTDEAIRAGCAFDVWAVNRFPLLERGMSKWDCIRTLQRLGRPIPPKSACLMCPYRTDTEWLWLKVHDPESFEVACLLDEALRHVGRVPQFVHRSANPLREVDFSTPEERGQGFMMVCEAGCGL